MIYKSLRVISSVLLLVAVCLPAAAEQQQAAAVATAHPMATQAGVNVLRQGGNAFDAAIAVTAALAVVEPFGSGIGGGGFWLLYLADEERYVVVDGREIAPAEVKPQLYYGISGEPVGKLSRDGPLSAGIPGVPAALQHLADNYACLPMNQTLEPAIEYARAGFKVTERYRRLARYRQEVLQLYKRGADIFLDKGEVPEPGYLVVQNDLADTLELMAARGASAFYTGSVAVQMVRAVRQAGGIWKISDLAAYRVKEREPLINYYKGMRVISMPPPSAGGIIMAMALGIIEQIPEQEFARDPEHYTVEAMRRAGQIRTEYLGDPDFNDIPVQQLLHIDHIKQLAASVLAVATPSESLADPLPEGEDTTHFSVVDFAGNRVAATLSINLPFGSGFVAADTGVLLNDEMDDFSMKELVPNRYELVSKDVNLVGAGRRPLSSMTPTFLELDDRIAILGTPGGSRIPSMVLLATMGFYAGYSPQEMVDIPRYHHQFMPDEIQHEPGALDSMQIKHLQRLGHKLKDVGRMYGNMHIIEVNGESVVAASDRRGEGEAVVIPLPDGPAATCQR